MRAKFDFTSRIGVLKCAAGKNDGTLNSRRQSRVHKTLSPSICPFRRTEIIVLPVSFLTQQAAAAAVEKVSADSPGFLRNV